jgi:hypothetical protein
MLRVTRASDGAGMCSTTTPVRRTSMANGFLVHLTTRNFSPATRRAYAYDLLNPLRFCDERGLRRAEVRRRPSPWLQPTAWTPISVEPQRLCTGRAPGGVDRRRGPPR